MPAVTRHPQHTKALLMLLLANAFWGLSFPAIKAVVLVHESLLPGSGNWFVTAMSVTPRYILAALVMLLWQVKNLGQITRGELRQGVELGLFASIGTVLQNDGLQFTSASVSAFLTQLYAVLIPALVALRLRRSPGIRVWVCGILVLAGVAILGHFDWKTLSFGRGEWETLACSVFFMGQILCLERREFSNNNPLRITLVMFSVQAVVFSGLLLGTAPSAAAVLKLCGSLPWIGLTLALTVTCTLGAFLIMNTWQPKITATEAGLIYCFEPIFGSLLALFLPALFSVWCSISYGNETATWSLLMGGGLITVANVLLQLRPPPKG
jgi:drug/metabolite transporter (DMT)-like permease